MKQEKHARISLLLLLLAAVSLLAPSSGGHQHRARQSRLNRAVYFALDNYTSHWQQASSSKQQQNQQQQQQQPGVLEQCCACDEAKYELVFEGLWSRYTHPEDFPENHSLAYFSDIIGASHSNNFRMWALNSFASDGVRELAETGLTKRLESELKQVSAKTRTIIKARELRQPLLTSKTSAVFRTDRQHHLVSVLSKLGPSPDWMLGVSSLELCQADCSWTPQRVVNLQLLDAGTDSGATFSAADQPTRPQQRIRYFRKAQAMQLQKSNADSAAEQYQLRENAQANSGNLYEHQIGSPSVMVVEENSHVADGQDGQQVSGEGNPMSSEQLKPFARLTITRQRIYEKSCDSAQNGNQQQQQHSSWRNREAATISELPNNGATDEYPTELVSTAHSLDCRFTDWSDWSVCSSQCGKGIRTRTRSFVAHDDQTVSTAGCQQADLIEKQICLSECSGSNVTCVTLDWSEWSRCSSACGQGYRKRTRAPISGRKCDSVDLAEMEQCTGGCAPDGPQVATDLGAERRPCELDVWSQWSECSVACGRGTMIRVRQFAKREDVEHCRHVKLIEKQPCMGKSQSCSRLADKACSLPPQSGPCTQRSTKKWYFDSSDGKCHEFTYGGCLGNSNNFRNIHECYKICVEARKKPATNHSDSNSNGTHEHAPQRLVERSTLRIHH